MFAPVVGRKRAQPATMPADVIPTRYVGDRQVVAFDPEIGEPPEPETVSQAIRCRLECRIVVRDLKHVDKVL